MSIISNFQVFDFPVQLHVVWQFSPAVLSLVSAFRSSLHVFDFLFQIPYSSSCISRCMVCRHYLLSCLHYYSTRGCPCPCFGCNLLPRFPLDQLHLLPYSAETVTSKSARGTCPRVSTYMWDVEREIRRTDGLWIVRRWSTTRETAPIPLKVISSSTEWWTTEDQTSWLIV